MGPLYWWFAHFVWGHFNRNNMFKRFKMELFQTNVYSAFLDNVEGAWSLWRCFMLWNVFSNAFIPAGRFWIRTVQRLQLPPLEGSYYLMIVSCQAASSFCLFFKCALHCSPLRLLRLQIDPFSDPRCTQRDEPLGQLKERPNLTAHFCLSLNKCEILPHVWL